METTEIEEVWNFLIILDCREQISSSKKKTRSISFIGFLVAEDTTVQSLANLILK